MASEQYYLIADSTGAVTGSGYSPDGTLPSGVVACTQAQAKSPQSYTVSNGAVVGPSTTQQLAEAKQAKVAEIIAAANAAMTQPISFTNAAGTQASFPMDQNAQLKYLATYTRYVVHGKSLPNGGVSFMDVQGNPISMTVADIDNMSDPVFGQIEAVENKASGYYSQINAVTTSTTNPVQTVQVITW